MQAEAQGNTPTLSVSHRKRPDRRRGLALLLLFLLLIGGVAFLFRPQAHVSTRQLPTTLHWQQVLPQYAVESLVAAPSAPTVLYACALPPLNPNALLSPTDLSQNQPRSGIFLRSRDAGVHWQVLDASLGDHAFCSIAVNPMNANDLYLSAIDLTSSNLSVFEHSRDGGQTWTTLQATLIPPSHTQNVPWEGGRLSFVGNHLFAIQFLQGISHLISSSDGGQTWTILDAHLIKAHQEMLSYVADPTAPTTLYELVGRAVVSGQFVYLPGGATPPPAPSPVPIDQLVRHLYKTVDGGATWQEILSSVPYGSSLQLAPTHPHLLYVGGLTGRMSASSQSTFHMQYSADDGKTWQSVAIPPNVRLSNNWRVDASGLLYVTADNPDKHHPSVASIQRYDPSNQQWSTLPAPPVDGGLLTVTSAVSNGRDLLWFISLETALYRGTM